MRVRLHDRMWTIATLCLFLLGASLASVADASRLDRFLERKMAKARVPGMAVAVLVDGELAWTQGYGWADIENRVPVTPDTLFLIASISKLFTATSVMRLHDKRGLDLDQDVSLYLPFEVRHPAFPNQPITLRHLMTHTSSISDRGTRDIRVPLVTEGDWPGSLPELLRDYLTPDGPNFGAATSFHDGAPGTRAQYSNVGYALLGLVVEHIAGRSFESFQQKVILRPLGMTESSWFLRRLDPDHVAVPYSWDGESYDPYPHLGMAFYPAGQLRTSARQLAQFASLHLARGKFRGRRILKRTTANEMTRVQFPEVDPIRGLGFTVLEDEDTKFAAHAGGFFGCSTELWLELHRDLGIILLTNGDLYGDVNGKRVRAIYQMLGRLFREAQKMDASD